MTLALHSALLLQMLFLLITCNNFYDYVQIKTLMRLQKTIAGGDEKLIIKFMWPNWSDAYLLCHCYVLAVLLP